MANDCPFCIIATTYSPYDPRTAPSPDSPLIRPLATHPDPPTYLLLSTPSLLAFLDILPLSQGHILLCPRRHAPKLTDATPTESRELGNYLRVLSAAVVRVTGAPDWNVVQNNGAAAAQVVPHMHFHIIPRPELRNKAGERFTSTMFGRGQREELEEDDAVQLAAKIRGAVAELLQEESHNSPKGKL